MFDEKFKDITVTFDEYQSTLLSIILSGDRLQSVSAQFAGPDENESLQSFKSRRKSIRVHDSKSFNVDRLYSKSEQVQTFRESPRAHVSFN